MVLIAGSVPSTRLAECLFPGLIVGLNHLDALDAEWFEHVGRVHGGTVVDPYRTSLGSGHESVRPA